MLTIGQGASAAYRDRQQEQFVATTKAEIRRSLGPETAHLSDAQLDARVRAASARAQDEGITSPTAAARYGALAAVYGDPPEDNPEMAAGRTAFHDRSLSDDARMNALQDATMSRRLAADNGPGLIDWNALQTRFRESWPMDEPKLADPKRSCSAEAFVGCCTRRLVVRCSHQERAYVLRLPGKKGAPLPVFDLVTGADGCDETEIEFDGGPCIRPRDAPYVTLTGPDLRVRHRRQLKEKLRAPGLFGTADARLVGLANHLGQDVQLARSAWSLMFGSDSLANVYALGVDACEAPATFGATLRVFPNYSASLSFTGKLMTAKWNDGEAMEDLEHDLGIAFSLSYLGRTRATKLDVFKPIAALVRQFLNMRSDAAKADEGEAYPDSEKSWSLTVLEGAVTGTMAIAERHAAPTHYRQGKIAFKLDPLFEIRWRKDILPAAVRRVGAFGGIVGTIVAEVLLIVWKRYRKSKYQPVKVRLDFIIAGKVTMELAYATDVDGNWTKAEADRKFGGSMGVKASLEGEIGAKTKYLMMLFKGKRATADDLDESAERTLKASASSGISIDVKDEIVADEPACSGQLVFTGLIVELAISGDTAKTTLTGRPRPKPDAVTMAASTSSEPAKWELLSPRSWPADPKPRPLAELFDG